MEGVRGEGGGEHDPKVAKLTDSEAYSAREPMGSPSVVREGVVKQLHTGHIASVRCERRDVSTAGFDEHWRDDAGVACETW